MTTRLRFNTCLVVVLSIAGSMLPVSAALVVNPPAAITEIITVQPIIVSDTDGANTASFFGTTVQQASIERFIDTIWAQAGIDVNFLAPNPWKNTFANWGAGGPPDNSGKTRPVTNLDSVVRDGVTAGVTNTNPNVINMYFVNIPAGFSLLGANNTAGIGYIADNGIMQYVGANLPGFAGGQEAVASVVSHEIGHNLGLGHIAENENLMQATGASIQGERLNNAQTATALASNFTTPVPVPPALILMLSGLVSMFGLFGRKRRKIKI